MIQTMRNFRSLHERAMIEWDLGRNGNSKLFQVRFISYLICTHGRRKVWIQNIVTVKIKNELSMVMHGK
jgi:hypothetical protein